MNVRRPDPEKLRAVRAFLKAAFGDPDKQPPNESIDDTLRRVK
jgi:hypothetical protein